MTADATGTAGLPQEGLEAARAAGLRYVTDAVPGITRRGTGKGFSYRLPGGERLTDREEIERIKALAIPPAWTDVWICPKANGHIQATGRDARGRKQYRYHPRWREVRDENKYGRLIAFGRRLPAIRTRVDQDLRDRGLPRQKVLAAAVRLLDDTLIRVGNPEYARENESFGLTTLQDEHVEIEGSELHFSFRGKSGKDHEVEFRDRRLARVVKACQDLPGQDLFQYLDEDGEQRTIASEDVNEYLGEIAGDGYTAKDFRTWGGTVLAAEALVRLGPAESETDGKRKVVAAIKEVAGHLRNTAAVCRTCYVHPGILESYADGGLTTYWEQRVARARENPEDGLRAEEAAVLATLQRQAERARTAA
jgi:DNA topoisomerase I